ncbi:MAG: DNA repair exonuclease [Clostridiales bacterium]|nr:DNA repair exonuclease [Clostridiales bacterium]
MRLIHCADLHLDSGMRTHLTKEKARERKKELLLTFQRMVEYAAENEVEAILIAGDLFDTRNISATACHAVWDAVCSHSEITFFYLKGNHDTERFLAEREILPDNFKTFGTEWTSWPLGERIVVSGLELTEENAGNAYHSLVLRPEKFHIVMLHGQETKTGAKDRAQVIRLRDLKHKGIDYLALRHIHSYKEGQSDAHGVWCYPGCLEGRGFDECGEHGFVLLDVDESVGTCTRRFVPFASRRLWEVPVDISACETPAEMLGRIREALGGFKGELPEAAKQISMDTDTLPVWRPVTSTDLVKVVLTGEMDVESRIDSDYLQKSLEPDFYFAKVSDETTLRVDADRFSLDETLKGEFVRTVMAAEDLSEEERATVIRFGLRAIAGEEVLGCD